MLLSFKKVIKGQIASVEFFNPSLGYEPQEENLINGFSEINEVST